MKEMIKQTVKAFVILLLVLAGIWATIWYGFGVRNILEGDLMAAFASDMNRFVVAHKGKLPADWTEFEQWQTGRDGRSRWRAAGSAERFEMLAPPYLTVDEVPRYIAVKNPKFKGMEALINERIYAAYYELGMTNNMANKVQQGIR